MKTWKWVVFLIGITLAMGSTCSFFRKTIFATADAGGSIMPAGDVDVAIGGSCSFVITPDDSHEIKDVLVDGKSVGAVAGYSFKGVFDDHTIHAGFRAKANEAGSFRFTEASCVVSEGAGCVVLVVLRSGGSKGAVSVSHATSNGTAKAGEDYIQVSNTLSWADGDSAGKNVVVDITDDYAVEADETFTVTLSSPQGGAELGSPASATVTISNNDRSDTE